MESKNDSACLRNYPKSWKAGARILSCLVLFAGLIVSRASGQANPVPNLPTPTITQPPLSYLYLSFLISQNHLDKAAATREAEGKDGAWLRNHFQDRLGFTGSQFSVIRSTGLRLESELKELQARVAVAI